MSGEIALLTSSRLRSYRSCARKHHHTYNEGWRPVRESEALRVGTLVHLGLEAWWNALPAPTGAALPLAQALAAVHGRANDGYEQARVDEMLRGYHERWIADAVRYDVVAVEAAFEVPLLNPKTMAASRTWRLAGKVDGIVRERATGRVLVLEHKTTVSAIESDADDYWPRLAMDHQCSAYVLGAEGMGHVVGGIVYDVIRKPGAKPYRATPPEKRKYKKDGTLYASQRERDETPGEYRARVRADVASRPERYFQRREIPRVSSQLRDFMFDAWQQAKQMRAAQRLGLHPRNPEACTQYGRCWLWHVCSDGERLDEHPDRYVRLRDVHPELKEDPA